MKKYSVNYTKSNNNFIIANIKNKKLNPNDLKYIKSIKVIKNILTRGLPTKPSKYLREKYNFKDDYSYLISKETPIWHNTIKGAPNSTYNPAKTFLYEIIDEYLPEYSFIKNLIIPEESIEEIEQKEIKELKNEVVDFYLPQAKLVIEIDGTQHQNTKQKDNIRDNIQTSNVIRINTEQIKNKDDSLKKKIIEIKKYLLSNEIINQYKEQLKKDYNQNKLDLIIISRIQILLLELLLTGNLSLTEEYWYIDIPNISDKLIKDAFQDLITWLDKILKLQDISCSYPKLVLHQKDSILIDFDLLKRYTDEYNLKPNIIYIRNDYYENDRNYFELETDTLINYKIKEQDQEKIKILKWFIQNIFDFNTFKPGQLEIIINILNLNDTIGILPTGTGKSLCYQLASLLQPGSTFIICPITSLMKDQQDIMLKQKITNTTRISHELEEDKKEKALEKIMKGKSLLTWITPERFQMISFRDSLKTLASQKNIAYMIIDEVHCMSEWGHDFRISYLQLIKTIKKIVKDPTILGLTATASNQVLKDIMISFGINKNDYSNVKSSNNFTRKELEFIVYNTNEEKKNEVLLNVLNKVIEIDNNSKSPFPGIVFVPFATGIRGAFQQSVLLKNKYPNYKEKISYFSGKLDKKCNLTENEFLQHKIQVQEKFKQNDIHLLFATKAFGMGIDKPDIRYIIHYGCSNSLEAFYQEVGRAGRDGKKAQCIVIHGQNEKTEEETNKYLESYQDIDKIPNSWGKGDIWDQITLFKLNKKSLSEEVKSIYQKFEKLSPNKTIKFPYFESMSDELEQAIYKLSLLGIIDDWTINYKDNITVKCSDYNNDSVKRYLEKYINKYDEEFKIDNLKEKYKHYQKILTKNNSLIKNYIEILCTWYNEEITYRRLASIKYIDELMNDFKSTEEFNQIIKNYFSYTDDSLYLRQLDNKSLTYDEVFSLLHKERNVNKKFKDKAELQNLKATLSSLLVENRHHTAYNLLSGLLRLMLDDYDTFDCETRLRESLEIINELELNHQSSILEKILTIESILTDENKTILANILKDYFHDFKNLYKIYEKIASRPIKEKIFKIELEKIKDIERNLTNE